MAMTVEEFVGHMDDVAESIEQMQFAPMLEEIVPIIQEGQTDNFAMSRAADGTPWSPHKNPKAMNPLLILTSALVQSVGGQSGDSIVRVTDTSLEVGTKDKKAAFHEYGTVHMDARPFIDVTEDTLQACEDVLAERFGELLGQ